ncbi:hypothetical protein TH0249_10280 [Helicobacter pylori]|nr:hypothetical protein [Helicobacter pylori]
MWNERFLKVVPGLVFLFCLLEIFELVLIVNSMNESEKIEVRIRNDLKESKDIIILLNESLESFKDKKIKIK